MSAWTKAAVFACVVSITTVGSVSAQVPVTDVASITQRAQDQLQTIAQMVSQLEQLKAQLDQAQRQYKSTTGSRGMGSLLSGENYAAVPTDWHETLDMMNGAGKYAGISGLAKKVLGTMNGVDPKVFDDVDSAYGKLYGSQAGEAATYQALQGTAYNNTSARFGRLKTLVAKIDEAPDMKAVGDLNARIGAEQVMLQNEQLKMQALAQLRQSQKDMEEVRMSQMRAETGKVRWVNMENSP